MLAMARELRTDIAYAVGDRLTDLMIEKGVSVVRLAELSGVPEYVVLDIMAGRPQSWPGCLCQIAQALGVCARDLRTDDGYPVFIRRETMKKLADSGMDRNGGLEELADFLLDKAAGQR